MKNFYGTKIYIRIWLGGSPPPPLRKWGLTRPTTPLLATRQTLGSPPNNFAMLFVFACPNNFAGVRPEKIRPISLHSAK